MKKIYLLLASLLFITEVNAAEKLSYLDCNGFQIPFGAASVINTVVNLAYIGVPLAIILTGSTGFIKAMIANDQKGIEGFKPIFISKLKAGTVVFLTFTVVKLLVSFVSDAAGNDINQCLECLINDKSCGTEIESPHKVEIPQDQDYYVPEYNGPSLDGESYEKGEDTKDEAEALRDPNNNKNDSDSDDNSNSDSDNDSESENKTEEELKEEELTTNDTTTGD